jgi:hypothetical protein
LYYLVLGEEEECLISTYHPTRNICPGPQLGAEIWGGDIVECHNYAALVVT